jgi:hypothetical protein
LPPPPPPTAVNEPNTEFPPSLAELVAVAEEAEARPPTPTLTEYAVPAVTANAEL